MKKTCLLLSFFLAGGLLSGCGYTTGSTLSSNLKTIHVEPFKNKIDFSAENRRNLYYPLIEVDVRKAIVDRFHYDGNLKVTESGSADLVLKGQLENYDRGGLRYTDNDDVQEYRIHVIVSLELWNSDTGEMMWSEPSFAGEATYFITGPQATSEEAALQEAIIDLARRIVERTIEDW